MSKQEKNFLKKATVYKQNYHGDVVEGATQLKDGDTYHEGLGMAIAKAKCELEIRKREYYAAMSVAVMIKGAQITTEIDLPDTQRRFERIYQQACEDANNMQRFYHNQKQLVYELVSMDGSKLDPKATHTDIISGVMKKILKNGK